MRKPVLTPQGEDFPRWYQEVVAKAELAENGPVRGTMVIRPWAYALWERLQRELDDRIRATGTQNAYFPLLIPERFLHREAQHIEGFSPELAVVTHGGGKLLEEPVVVRPTSETIINSFFAKWINSYRDLPLKVNNWSNVVRWELRPRLFLRTTEFLWQEGHTAHVDPDEAQRFARQILTDVYRSVMVDVMAIPVITGLKTRRESFAGAVRSWTCEGIMRDRKALQMGTSHELGQNFSKAFDIAYTDAEGEQRTPWQTSWGASTRLLGALIMAHGDDHGLRLPPRLAATQLVVLLVDDRDGAGETAVRLRDELLATGVRAVLDDRADLGFGRRAVDWELKGAPLRLEVGPRDLIDGNVTLVSRARGEKTTLRLADVGEAVRLALEVDQRHLHDDARRTRDESIVNVGSVEDAIEQSRTGVARLPWAAVGVEGEQRIVEAGASVRCLTGPDDQAIEPGDADLLAIVARAY